MIHSCRHQAPHLLGIRRRDDGHARQRAKDGDVLDGFVRWTQRGIHHPAAVGDQADVDIVQAKVQGDLLETTPGEKSGDGVDVNNFSFEREAGGDAHDVRLAHAFHQETVGHLRLELLQSADPEVRADEKNPLLLAGQLIHHVQTGLAHYSFTSNSASKDLTSSSVTLFLWCQFKLFSTKRAPLPLMVWQMMALGLSGANGV